MKGNKINDFDSDIKKGIQLHREIDQFTDSHPIVRESKLRLRADFRHYSPVIVDVFYDHNVKLLASAAAKPIALYHGKRMKFAFDEFDKVFRVYMRF